jgi:hypothetical protein
MKCCQCLWIVNVASVSGLSMLPVSLDCQCCQCLWIVNVTGVSGLSMTLTIQRHWQHWAQDTERKIINTTQKTTRMNNTDKTKILEVSAMDLFLFM